MGRTLSLLPLLGVLLGGCTGSASEGPPAQPLTVEQQMKNLDESPNMTPEAKVQAQAALSRGQAMGQGMRASGR